MTRSHFITLLFTFVTASGFAQYMSVGGRFQVAEKSGCAPFTVNITTTPSYPCGPCDMNYNGDGIFLSYAGPADLVHTYTQPGTYWLGILYQSTGYDSLQIEVLDDTP